MGTAQSWSPRKSRMLPVLLMHLQLVRCAQPGDSELPPVVVSTSRGLVRGFHVDNDKLDDFYQGNGDVFLGIPFAASPIGDRRFQKSELIKEYKDTIEANRYGKICPQIDGEIHADKYGTGMGEDCLTINIFAPNVSDTITKYPVMVYIHGGALKFGDVVEWGYRGIISNLVRRGIIWVTFNYRVGLYGFFTTHTPEFPANRGIWDQVTALRWIQQEIGNFGGDRNRVTLIGHSSGACSASSLALSPAVDQSLFHAIILLSCSAEVCFDKIYGQFTQSFDRAEQICSISARTEGWTSANIAAMKDCLSNLNHTQISSYDAKPVRWNTVIDGELFTDEPRKMKWRNIPVLMGSTRDEYAIFEQWQLAKGRTKLADYTAAKAVETIRQWMRDIFGNVNVNEIMQLVYAFYGKPSDDEDSISNIKYVVRILSDAIYIRAVGEEAEMHISAGNKNVWLWHIKYRTDYFSFYRFKNYKPVFHGIELFWLMQPTEAWLETKRWGKEELLVADAVAEQFTQFAKTGSPSSTWEKLVPERMNYWKIGKELISGFGNTTDNILNVNDYGGKNYRFWKALASLFRKFGENLNLKTGEPPRADALSYGVHIDL